MNENEPKRKRPTAGPLFYDLRLVATNVLHSREPSEYVTHVHGQILLDPQDDADENDDAADEDGDEDDEGQAGDGPPPGDAGDAPVDGTDADADAAGATAAAAAADDDGGDGGHEDGAHMSRGKVVAGRLALTVYDLDRARADREDPFCVFDAVGQEALDLYHALFEDGFELFPHVAAAAGDPDRPSLVCVEAVELLPRFRGRGLGRAAALRALYLFGPAGGLAAVLAAPLCAWPRLDGYDEHDPDDGDAARWRRRLAVDRFPPDSAAVRRKLGAYWGRLGFRPVGDDLCVRGLADPLPRVADVLADPRGGGGGGGGRGGRRRG
jgi:hypothetical protein